jgi:DNA polymerase-3 subunit gamma/tau
LSGSERHRLAWFGRSDVTSTTPHQAIYRRWRSQTFGQIVGQKAVVETLRNGIRSGRSAHAYLFVGPRGTGKTSMARILAKALNCTDLRDGEPCDVCPSCVAIREGRALDVSEMDAASNNRVDDMRELLPRIYTTPSDLRRKVFIVDEVQRIREGWDVLLKTLEEPPDHVVFVFCTTDASQIRPAVLSRVQRFDFRRMTVSEISGKLRAILAGDGREAEPEAIDLIARLAAGGMRDAESMLDQLLTTNSGPLTAERVREVLGLVEEETVEAFLLALVRGEAVVGIDLLDGLEEHGRDLRAFTEQAIERLRGALVASLGRGPQPGLASIGPIALASAARRLSSIDPARQGPGGLRLQLELALLEPSAAGSQRMPETVAARTTASARPERSTPTPLERPIAPARPIAPRLADASGAASLPAAPPPPRRPTNGPTLQLLLERWAEVVEVISKSPPTKPLIVACRPVAVEGSVVTLGFPEAQSFFKDVAERRRAVLEEGVSRVLGIPVTVHCVAANVEVAQIPEDPDGARLLTEFRRIYGDDAAGVKEIG